MNNYKRSKIIKKYSRKSEDIQRIIAAIVITSLGHENRVHSKRFRKSNLKAKNKQKSKQTHE